MPAPLLQVVAEYAAQAGGRGAGPGLDLSSVPLWGAVVAGLAGLWLLLGRGGGLVQRLAGMALLGAAVYLGAPAAGFSVPW